VASLISFTEHYYYHLLEHESTDSQKTSHIYLRILRPMNRRGYIFWGLRFIISVASFYIITYIYIRSIQPHINIYIRPIQINVHICVSCSLYGCETRYLTQTEKNIEYFLEKSVEKIWIQERDDNEGMEKVA
jgi:hypothetical protein